MLFSLDVRHPNFERNATAITVSVNQDMMTARHQTFVIAISSSSLHLFQGDGHYVSRHIYGVIVCVVLCKGFDIERVLTKCPTLKSARPSVSEECLYWCSLPKKSLLERDFESGSCTHALLSTFPSNGIQSNLGLTCL